MKRNYNKSDLQYYYDVLKNISYTEKTISSVGYKVISNWEEIVTVLYKIHSIESINSTVKEIFDLGENFKAITKEIALINPQYNQFIILIKILCGKLEVLMHLDCRGIEDNVIQVKLPDSLDDLEELSKICKSIDLAFNKCPILNDYIGKVSFSCVKEGSNWIVLILDHLDDIKDISTIICNVATFIGVCIKISKTRKEMQNLDLELILKRCKLEKQFSEAIYDNYEKSVLNEIKDDCVKEFRKLSFSSSSTITPEEEEKIALSMKQIMDLTDKGVEFYASESADESIKKLFVNSSTDPQKYLSARALLGLDEEKKK